MWNPVINETWLDNSDEEDNTNNWDTTNLPDDLSENVGVADEDDNDDKHRE